MVPDGSFLDNLKRLRSENEELRQRLRVTLYGPFHPPKEKDKLSSLASEVRARGYSNCDIVEGPRRPNPPDNQGKEWPPNEISKFYLMNSDVNLLIYTDTGINQGVITEGNMLSSDPELTDSARRSYAYMEETDGHRVLGDMARSQFESRQIRIQPFRDLDHLIEQLISRVRMEFKHMHQRLKYREPLSYDP